MAGNECTECTNEYRTSLASAIYHGRLSRSEFHDGQVPLKASGSCSWCWYSSRHIQRVVNIFLHNRQFHVSNSEKLRVGNPRSRFPGGHLQPNYRVHAATAGSSRPLRPARAAHAGMPTTATADVVTSRGSGPRRPRAQNRTAAGRQNARRCTQARCPQRSGHAATTARACTQRACHATDQELRIPSSQPLLSGSFSVNRST